MEKIVATTVRMPEEIKLELEKIAKKETRSLNSQILVAIKEYIANHPTED